MHRPICFDLYFTLIEPDPEHQGLALSAALLNIETEVFQQASMMSFDARMIGTLRTPEEVVEHALTHLERQVDPQTYQQLVDHRWGFFHGLRLYADVWETLTTLKQRGHPLALVTNCSAETDKVLDRLQLRQFFSSMALSCDVGAAKPDPRMYQHVIDELNLDPSTIIYVGDGDTQEHAGAAHFNMTTVLLHRPQGIKREVQADYTISSLTELLKLPILEY